MFVEDIDRLRLDVSDREKQIHALEQAKDALHGELRLAKSNLSQADEAVTVMAEEIAALKRQLTEAKARHGEIQLLEERVAEADTALSNLSALAEGLKAGAEHHLVEIGRLSDELAAANALTAQQDKELETTREIMQALHERSFLDALISKGVASLTRTKTPA